MHIRGELPLDKSSSDDSVRTLCGEWLSIAFAPSLQSIRVAGTLDRFPEAVCAACRAAVVDRELTAHDPYNCGECGQTFAYLSELIAHRQETPHPHHKGGLSNVGIRR